MTSFRIATFNVLSGGLFSWAESWSGRLPLLRRSIEAARADVLGLQEVLPSTLADASRLVAPLTFVPGPATTAPSRYREGEHLPIAYRSDRFSLLDSGGFWISDAPDRAGSKLPLARKPFLVHWARLAEHGSGSLLILNAHFGHAPWHHAPTARIVTAQRARLEAANAGEKEASSSMFLLGDFNAVPSSQLLRELTSRSGGFVDAARSAAERVGPPVTYHWGRGATRLGLWLDHVLARTSLRPTRAEVLETREGRRFPSDHHPLVVTFEDRDST